MKSRIIELQSKKIDALTEQVEKLLEEKKKLFAFVSELTMSHEDFNVKDGLDFREERELNSLTNTLDEVQDKQQVTVVGINKKTA